MLLFRITLFSNKPEVFLLESYFPELEYTVSYVLRNWHFLPINFDFKFIRKSPIFFFFEIAKVLIKAILCLLPWTFKCPKEKKTHFLCGNVNVIANFYTFIPNLKR